MVLSLPTITGLAIAPKVLVLTCPRGDSRIAPTKDTEYYQQSSVPPAIWCYGQHFWKDYIFLWFP